MLRHYKEIPRNSSATHDDAIVGAAFLRLTAEAYLLLDPRAGTPRQRWQWLLALHAAAERDAWQRVPRRRPRLAAAAHRHQIRQAPRAPRLAPRRRLDAILQKTTPAVEQASACST